MTAFLAKPARQGGLASTFGLALESAFRFVKAHRKAAVGIAIIAGLSFASILAPLLTRWEPTELVAAPNEAPSFEHLFGTTGQGQDVFAQTLYGARSSLLVGFSCGLLATGIGAMVGVGGALARGWVDDVLALLTNIFLVLPALPLAVIVAAYLPPGPIAMGSVLVVTGWAWNARTLRAQALSLREKDFVAAAIVSGEGRLRIVTHEILPNMAQLLVSVFVSATIAAIGAEVGLEFLGVGDVTRVSWGTNLYWASNDAALLTSAWWTFVPTGACVALVGFGLALINFAIDEIADPRLRTGRGAPRASSTPVARESR